MKKHIILIPALLVSLTLVASAHAENQPARATAEVKLKSISVKATREKVDAKQTGQALREKANEMVSSARAEAEKRIEAKKIELKEKLIKIKDEKKKQVVEKIEVQLNEINTRLVANLTDAVSKIETILARIEARAETLGAKGVDVTAVRKAVADGKISIESAHAAIKEQAGKVYSVSDVITAETKLKQDIGALRKKIGDDLKTVKELVKVAKDSVRAASAALPKMDSDKSTSTDILENQ